MTMTEIGSDTSDSEKSSSASSINVWFSNQQIEQNREVITGCSLSDLRARKLLGKNFFLANAFSGITGFSELANSLGK